MPKFPHKMSATTARSEIRTRRSPGLLTIYPRTLVEINPQDAATCGVVNCAAVRIVSRRGEMLAEALVTDRLEPGVIFSNFHFPGVNDVNNLTIGALDPLANYWSTRYAPCASRKPMRSKV